jgi:3-hydroxyisobutyrate dehydrogenase-like beta-hydroxyacid dehydrogenase
MEIRCWISIGWALDILIASAAAALREAFRSTMTPPVTPLRPVGLVGLGLMGKAFAARLLAGGRTVVGYDVDAGAREALSDQGVDVAATASEVVQRCDRILFSLPSHREVGEVIADVSGALRRGQVIIDTTTGDPDHAVTLARELAERGIAYLDATISGNSAQVRQGTSTVMVGGDAGAFAVCEDLLANLGRTTFHTGPSGTGAKMKLVTNLVLGLNRAALAEGLALGEAIGLEPELTLRVMRESPAYSRIMDVKGEKMIHSEFSPDARLSQHLKDVRLILEWGAQGGLPMTMSEAHRTVLEQAEAAGLGVLDNSALIEVLRGRCRDSQSLGPRASRPQSSDCGDARGPREKAEL